jgi:hypothetical protein
LAAASESIVKHLDCGRLEEEEEEEKDDDEWDGEDGKLFTANMSRNRPQYLDDTDSEDGS